MKFYAADAHCDYLFGAMEYGWTIDTQKRNQTITLENLKKGGVTRVRFQKWLQARPIALCPLNRSGAGCFANHV